MNGFEVLAPVHPGLLERIRHHPPKENAFIELRNIIAQTPLVELPLDRVQPILNEYESSRKRTAASIRFARELRQSGERTTPIRRRSR
jgi:hypothetical protein